MPTEIATKENRVRQAAEMYHQAATEQMTQRVTEEKEDIWNQEEEALARERHRHAEITQEYQACLQACQNSATQEIENLRLALQQGQAAHTSLQSQMQSERDQQIHEQTTLRRQLAQLHQTNQDLQLHHQEVRRAEVDPLTTPTTNPPISPIGEDFQGHRQHRPEQPPTVRSIPPPQPYIHPVANQFGEITRFKERDSLVFEPWPNVTQLPAWKPVFAEKAQ